MKLWGTYFDACAPRLPADRRLEVGRGAVVNVSLIVGLGAFPGRSAYGAAKAGIGPSYRDARLRMGTGRHPRQPPSLRPTRSTPMVRDLSGPQEILILPAIQRRTPLCCAWGCRRKMAQAAAFLLSDWASYITGVVLPVDGGWSVYGAAGDVVKIRTGEG